LLGINPVRAAAAKYGFELSAKPSALRTDKDNGDTIIVTGAGTFDTGGAVSGGGAWTHIDENGDLKARGHWKPTEFMDFEAFEGPNRGTQGGVLVIKVDLTRTDGEVFPAELTITCPVNAPDTFDGTKGIMLDLLGSGKPMFMESTGGFTLFNLIKD